MKKIYFLLLIFLISCESEYFIPDNVKSALPIDYYNINDTLKLSYSINGEIQDSISLIVSKNEVVTEYGNDYVFGTKFNVETYYFEAYSTDNNQGISIFYESMDNLFNGYVNLNAINFSFDIIEKKIDSIEINNILYKNLFIARSEYHESTYAYLSNENGIIEVVNDSIMLSTNN